MRHLTLRVTRLATVALLAAAAFRTLPAQTLGSVGGRVRLEPTDRDSPPVVGTLLGTRGDTVFVRDGADAASTVAVPVSGIRQLQISTGRHSHILAGIGLGVLIGGAAGAALGAATTSNSCQTCAFGGGSDKALGAIAGVLVGGMGGLLIGGVVGALVRTDRWVTVPATILAPRLTFDPRRAAVGIRFSLALGRR